MTPIPPTRASDRCPHCDAAVGVEPDGTRGQKCLACGGPRIFIDDPALVRRGSETPLLRRARAEQVRQATWALGAAVVGTFGFLSLLLALLVAWLVDLGAPSGLALAFVVLVPLVLAFMAWRRASAHGAAARAAHREAQVAAAGDLAQSRGEPPEATELARLLCIDELRAEQVLAELQVNELLREPAPPRLRLTDGAPAGAPSVDTETTAGQGGIGRNHDGG